MRRYSAQITKSQRFLTNEINTVDDYDLIPVIALETHSGYNLRLLFLPAFTGIFNIKGEIG